MAFLAQAEQAVLEILWKNHEITSQVTHVMSVESHPGLTKGSCPGTKLIITGGSSSYYYYLFKLQ